MKNIISVSDDMKGFYKNIGKSLFVFNGNLRESTGLQVKKVQLMIIAETESEYCAILGIEGDEFIRIAKSVGHSYCCSCVVDHVDVWSEGIRGAGCRLCLREDNEKKAKSMMIEAIKEHSDKRVINLDGIDDEL